METMVELFQFYKNKTVFITGHSGFKGTWLCKILTMAGARVFGYSLPLENGGMKEFYDLSEVGTNITHCWNDIRDFKTLQLFFNQINPDIVFHLAAQPLVLDSYKNPVYTYETNVMGTVHILECVRLRKADKKISVLNVTTDKVYENKEWEWGYRENEPLDGYDPYSNSKSCSELVTHSYNKSFFNHIGIAVSTARAGNVIGGGDFADKRIIPDCIRSVLRNEAIHVRNPYSMRPYQHVLEPLYAYLLIAAKQYENMQYADYYNVGPDECDCVTTGELVSLFCQVWGQGAHWIHDTVTGQPHEAKMLKLDCSRLKSVLKWHPVWHVGKAVAETVKWAKAYQNHEYIPTVMENQINEFWGKKTS